MRTDLIGSGAPGGKKAGLARHSALPRSSSAGRWLAGAAITLVTLGTAACSSPARRGRCLLT